MNNEVNLILGNSKACETTQLEIKDPPNSSLASLVAQRLKCLPGMQETQVRSLGREDPLEKKIATPSGILAWQILWRKEPGGLQSMELQKSGT